MRVVREKETQSRESLDFFFTGEWVKTDCYATGGAMRGRERQQKEGDELREFLDLRVV